MSLSTAVYFTKKSDTHGMFSNFALCVVGYEFLVYDSVEAAFQAAKTLDSTERAKFCHVSPATAKSMGRKLKLRPDWEQVKVGVMVSCLRSKFMVNEYYRKTLIDTGTALLLENTTGWNDNTWGRDFRCKNTLGRNFLGLCLMLVRSEFTKNPMVEFLTPSGERSFNIVTDFDELINGVSEKAMYLRQNYDWLYSEKKFVN